MLKYLHLFTMKSGKVLDTVEKNLRRAGYEPVRGKEFVYAAGSVPVLLVAHADTVHGSPPERGEIFYDRRKKVLWSPAGLGADDRAGVAAILELLGRGHRPHVLVTDGEERGGTGAHEAVGELPPPDVRYVLEMDRKNGGEAVFYDCENERFIRYVLGFGWRKEEGTFSDVSILCPAWNIAGVNVSIGYRQAHTSGEHLYIADWRRCVSRVEAMLKRLPAEKFAYEARKRAHHFDGFAFAGRRTVAYGVASTPMAFAGWYDDHVAHGHGAFAGEEFHVAIDAGDLASLYGGSVLDWEVWLAEWSDRLQATLEDLLWEEIDRLVRTDPPVIRERGGSEKTTFGREE